MEKLKEETKKAINTILDEGIQTNNIEILEKLTKIYKNAEESECMRYGNYGNYNGNYGNYNGRRAGYDSYGENYGRYNARGYDRKYRGHEKLDEMYDSYGRYSEGKEEYNRGNYGAKDDTMKSLEYMLQSMVQFVSMLKEEAQNQEEVELIRQYTRKISEM